MFTVYIVLTGVIGILVGVIIGDLKHTLVDKLEKLVESYAIKSDSQFKAYLENLAKDIENKKNMEIKNISAAETKDVNNVKSAVDSITPPKI